MEKLDFENIGLKAGLEIHQQLNTKKLFCGCPSDIRDDSPDKSVKRRLRAAAGETGTIDEAASHESLKGKHYIYEYYDDTTCLVELDEEPPLPLNDEALKVVLQLASMTNAEPVHEIHVMRKTVVDGSNTSGFQRTALIARNGSIDVESKGYGGPDEKIQVRIDTLCLEEDAARIISRNPDFDVYRLDRLGIPLIEIATGPDMKTPQQVKDTAAFIGMLLRSTGKVKRGLGTIRQDVNVSIKGGARVEIKGVQDLRIIDKVVELEALRQSNMLKLRNELISKKIIVDSKSPQDFTDKFSSVKTGFLRKGLDSGLKVYGKQYSGFNGMFGFELNPNRRFGSEISDRIKILGLNGLIHTDENIEKYGIADIVKGIYSDLHLHDGDSMIFILGAEEKCSTAFRIIDEFIKSFIEKGLDKHVRNAKDDGTSSYLRPMPGSARMYPETDVRTIIPDTISVEKPELIKDKIARLSEQYNIPNQVAKDLIYEPFEEYATKYSSIPPIIIANSLTAFPKEIKTLHNIEIDVQPFLDEIFQNISSGNIDSSSAKEVLILIAKGSSMDDALSQFKKADESELVDHITQIIEKHPNMNAQALMGETMKKYRGKFPGQRIMELIKKFKGE